MVIRHVARVTRDNQEPDVIYVGEWDDPVFKGETIFVTPDGIGRYYYDSIEEARDDVGDLPIVRAAAIED